VLLVSEERENAHGYFSLLINRRDEAYCRGRPETRKKSGGEKEKGDDISQGEKNNSWERGLVEDLLTALS